MMLLWWPLWTASSGELVAQVNHGTWVGSMERKTERVSPKAWPPRTPLAAEQRFEFRSPLGRARPGQLRTQRFGCAAVTPKPVAPAFV